jgi:hypothetical protein
MLRIASLCPAPEGLVYYRDCELRPVVAFCVVADPKGDYVAPIYLEAGQARIGRQDEAAGELLQHREALLRLDVDFPKRLRATMAKQVGQPRPTRDAPT